MSETITTDNLQVVVFSLVDDKSKKKEDYGVSIDQVREIRPLEAITKVPNTESYVKGIMNLRGMIIPVIDVKEKLGLVNNNPSGQQSRILVSEIDGHLTGLLIDEVEQVMRVPIKDIETTLSGGLESLQYIRGIAKTDGRLIVLLDLVKLLSGTTMPGTTVPSQEAA